MINLSDIYVHFGDRVLYNGVNFNLEKSEKVGLVGRNGTGKSTLLNLISGELTPDSGNITIQKGAKIGMLTQELPSYEDITLKELAISAFDQAKSIQDRIDLLNDKVEKQSHEGKDVDLSLFDELNELHTKFELLGGHQVEGKVEQVLKGLGFIDSDFDKKINQFSGGWIMRAELARLLLSNPEILLLDEPTNHLDIESIMWLEQYLIKSPFTLVVISHDKTFLSTVTNKTAEIEFSKLEMYSAPYSKYLKIKEERREIQISAFKNQQKVIAEKERTINRFMAKATKTKMAQSMKKQLDKMERVDEVVEQVPTMNIAFPEGKRAGRVVLKGKNIHKSYGPKNVLQGVNITIERGQKVAFVGQNGQGKTTLVKILLEKVQSEEGEVDFGHNVQPNYYAQNQADTLHDKKTLLESLEEDAPIEKLTKLRSILGAFLFTGEDVDKKVSVLSGGERARLAMAKMILHPSNLLVFDEPTNHLDIQSKEVLKQAIKSFEGTVVIVSHDRDFLEGLCEIIYEFKDHKIKQYLGDIEYFLEQKKLDSMREVEMKTKAKEVKKEKPKASREDLKKYRRQLQYAERDIANLEEDLKSFEMAMADPSFFDSENHQKEIDKYQAAKKSLESRMAEWEEIVEWLEENDE